MSKMSFYKLPNILSSAEGEAGADRLLVRIKNNDLGVDILPNTYPKYTGQLEEEDYLSYCRFLGCVNGKKLRRVLEVQDAREHAKF